MVVVFAILLFSLLIFVHELGHFVAAKIFNVQVNEFAMFMGPALLKWGKGGTQYSIRCIPIGGYCAMEGEDGGSDNPRSFGNAKWWKRLIILVAGAGMNLVMGLLIFVILYLPGNQIVEPVINDCMDCCIFNTADGLQEGDVIVKLDGEKIYVNGDIGLILNLNNQKNHDVTVLRDGKKLEFKNLEMAHTHLDDEGNEYLHYGFVYGEVKEVSFWGKVKFTWNMSIDTIRTVRISLQMLLRGQAGLTDMTGPVGIVQIMSDTAADSETSLDAVLSMLYFGGFLSFNLAVMNLLPIPALDGGRVVALLITTTIEKITKKKLNPKYEAFVHGAGMVLLLILMAVIFLKDIIMIFKG